MSNDAGYGINGPIAGEPAVKQPNKNIPPLRGSRKPTKPGNQKTNVKKSKRFIQIVQILTILVALILSAYSFSIIDSLENKSGVAGTDATEVLVRTEGREADHICTEGGADIFIGNDENRDGVLAESEVTSTTRICHGKEGLSGPQGATGTNGQSGTESLVSTTIVDYGNDTCFYGGIMITSGLDANSNNTLDAEEISSVEFVCNGQIGSNGIDGNGGHSALVEKLSPPSYICAQGFIINFAVDDGSGEGIADDGLIQDDEIIDSLKICSQPLNYGPISDFSIGVTNGMSNSCDAVAWVESKELIISSGSDSTSGCELWVSSGVASSTQQLIDINSGIGDSSPGLYLGLNIVETENGEYLFFDADSGVNGRELWFSDMTETGTVQITGYSGDGITSDSTATPWMGGLVFTDSNNRFMWTDGVVFAEIFDAPFISTANQLVLDSIANDISVHTHTSMKTDLGGLWFSGMRTGMGYEMHHFSNEGIITSWDLNSFEDSFPNSILSLENSAIVVADDGINGRQLARLNITGSHDWLTSLTLQSNGNPTTNVGEDLGLNLLGQQIIFDAQTSFVDPTVWSYNLTTGTATELSTLFVSPAARTESVTADGKIWFDCISGSSAGELCVTDGTLAGTKMIHEFQPGMASSEIRDISVHGKFLLLLVNGELDGSDTGHCLWSFNTETLVAEIEYDPWSGAGNSSDSGTYGELVVGNEISLFIADNGQTGHELHLWNPMTLTDEWMIWN